MRDVEEDMPLAGSKRFEYCRTLGEGGMGIVYEAHDKERNSRVALKMLRHLDASTLYQFKREFRALSDLSHPNIVALYELTQEGDDWFLTMEVVEGEDFITYVRGGRLPLGAGTEPARLDPMDSELITRTSAGAPLSRGGAVNQDVVAQNLTGRVTRFSEIADEIRLRQALAQLVQALTALHQQGMVHRDIKPSNVRVTPSGRVVLMDFGIVAETGMDDHRPTSAIAAGTPSYMAPEQAAGDPPTAAADWYALGVLLYRALTDRLPFEGPRDQVLLAKQHRDPTPPGEFVSEIPEELARLCLDLMARRPEARPRGDQILSRLGIAGDSEVTPIDNTVTGAKQFVGRSAELDVLMTSYQQASESGTACVIIRGASGMGKTTLVRRFLYTLDTENTTPAYVLCGRCHERESLSYKAFDGVVDDLSRHLLNLSDAHVAEVLPREVDLLTRLFPVLRRVPGIQVAHSMGGRDPRELREHAIVVLRALLANMARWRPIVLYIDDIQWADRDSQDLLLDLLRPPAPPRLLVVLSLRTDDLQHDAAMAGVHAVIDAIAGKHPSRDVALGPMSAEEQRLLAARLLRGSTLPAAMGDAFWAQSEGNPLLLAELVRYVEASSARIGTGEHPRIEEVLYQRVRKLPDDARALLDVLAVSGEPTPLWLLAEAIDQSAEARERASAILRVTRFARIARPGYQPWLIVYHDKVRETVVAFMDDDRRRSLHQRLAQALERWERATVDSLARHWLAAGDPALATTYLIAAADSAREKLAFERAAELYQAALELAPGADDRLRLLRALGETLGLAGYTYRAAQIHAEAAQLAGSDEAGKLRRRAAEMLVRSGHVEQGLSQLASLTDELGVPIPRTRRRALLQLASQRGKAALRGRRHRIRSESEIAVRDLDRLDALFAVALGVGVMDPICGAAAQARHMLTALRFGERRRLCRANVMEVFFLAVRGGRHARRAEPMSREVLLEAQRIGDPYLLALAQWTTGVALYQLGRFLPAEQSLAEVQRLLTSEVVGGQWELATARYYRSAARIELGRLSENRTVVERALDSAARREDLYARTLFACEPNTWRLLAADRPDEALRMLDETRALWPDEPRYTAHVLIALSRATCHVYRGDAAAASAALQEARASADALHAADVPAFRLASDRLAGQVALLAGDEAEARRVAKQLGRHDAPVAAGAAAVIEAALARRARDDEQAARALSDAVARFRDADAAHYLAGARLRLGELLGGSQGEQLAGEARAWATEQNVANPAQFLALVVA